MCAVITHIQSTFDGVCIHICGIHICGALPVCNACVWWDHTCTMYMCDVITHIQCIWYIRLVSLIYDVYVRSDLTYTIHIRWPMYIYMRRVYDIDTMYMCDVITHVQCIWYTCFLSLIYSVYVGCYHSYTMHIRWRVYVYMQCVYDIDVTTHIQCIKYICFVSLINNVHVWCDHIYTMHIRWRMYTYMRCVTHIQCTCVMWSHIYNVYMRCDHKYIMYMIYMPCVTHIQRICAIWSHIYNAHSIACVYTYALCCSCMPLRRFHMQWVTQRIYIHTYGVATISRLLKIIGLFWRISSVLQGSFAKETCTFQEPTNRSHPLYILCHSSIPPRRLPIRWPIYIYTYALCHSYTMHMCMRDVITHIQRPSDGLCVCIWFMSLFCMLCVMGWLRLVGSVKL